MYKCKFVQKIMHRHRQFFKSLKQKQTILVCSCMSYLIQSTSLPIEHKFKKSSSFKIIGCISEQVMSVWSCIWKCLQLIKTYTFSKKNGLLCIQISAMSNPTAFSTNIWTNKVCCKKHSPSARNKSCTYFEATFEQTISVNRPVAVNIYPCLHICTCSAAPYLPGSTEHMLSQTMLIFQKPRVELLSCSHSKSHKHIKIIP